MVDETVPLSHGVLGQETTGPGGICFALRTIPVDGRAGRGDRAPGAARVADQLHQPRGHGHRGGPAGARRPRGRASATRRRACAGASPPRSAATPPSCGSTTSGSTTSAGCAASATPSGDLLPDLLADDAALTAFEEGSLFGAEWLRTLGMIPNEYLYYFYYAADTVDAIRESPTSRGAYLLEQQARFYARNGEAVGGRARRLARDPPRARAHLHGRGAHRGGRRRRARGRRRAGRQRRLRGRGDGGGRRDRQQHPHDADLQHRQPLGAAVPGRRRRRRGARRSSAARARSRSPSARCPTTRQALVQSIKAVERATIEAALTGSPALAVKALALHPLVPSVNTAREIFEELPARGCPSCRSASDDRRRGRHHAVPRHHVHRARRRSPPPGRSATRASCSARRAAARSPPSARPGSACATALAGPLGSTTPRARCCAPTLEREGVTLVAPHAGPHARPPSCCPPTASARWSPTTRARAPARRTSPR